MKTEYYRIGALSFSVELPDTLTPPAHFQLFRTETQDADYHYRLDFSETLPEPVGILVAEREDIRVFQDGMYECRALSARGQEGVYAVYRECSEKEAEILCDPGKMELFSLDTVFSSLFALERRALSFDGLILHCACVEVERQGLLFTAPSGVGKSTQGSLWEKYRGAVVRNGDRALLLNHEGKPQAFGWPVCGSSEICSNTVLPVRAVITLSQEKENRCRQCTPVESYTSLFGQITINQWNREAVKKAMALLQSWIDTVPVFHLGCTVSEEAVACLERALLLEGI